MAIPVWCEPDYDDDDPRDPDNGVYVPMNNPGWETDTLWVARVLAEINEETE